MRSIVYGDLLLPDHPVSYYDVNKTNGAAEQSRPGLTDSDISLCLVERLDFSRTVKCGCFLYDFSHEIILQASISGLPPLSDRSIDTKAG